MRCHAAPLAPRSTGSLNPCAFAELPAELRRLNTELLSAYAAYVDELLSKNIESAPVQPGARPESASRTHFSFRGDINKACEC